MFWFAKAILANEAEEILVLQLMLVVFQGPLKGDRKKLRFTGESFCIEAAMQNVEVEVNAFHFSTAIGACDRRERPGPRCSMPVALVQVWLVARWRRATEEDGHYEC